MEATVFWSLQNFFPHFRKKLLIFFAKSSFSLGDGEASGRVFRKLLADDTVNENELLLDLLTSDFSNAEFDSESFANFLAEEGLQYEGNDIDEDLNDLLEPFLKWRTSQLVTTAFRINDTDIGEDKLDGNS